jgi:hypothetical protein
MRSTGTPRTDRSPICRTRNPRDVLASASFCVQRQLAARRQRAVVGRNAPTSLKTSHKRRWSRSFRRRLSRRVLGQPLRVAHAGGGGGCTQKAQVRETAPIRWKTTAPASPTRHRRDEASAARSGSGFCRRAARGTAETVRAAHRARLPSKKWPPRRAPRQHFEALGSRKSLRRRSNKIRRSRKS